MLARLGGRGFLCGSGLVLLEEREESAIAEFPENVEQEDA
jgi:hypothetical protein